MNYSMQDVAHYTGRQSPYAVQNKDGTYRVVHGFINQYNLEEHYYGRETIGTYTILEDNTCNTVTWDIDSDDVGDVYKLLPHIQGPYLVVSSGRKGFHVLQYFEDPIPSEDAFTYGNYVKAQAGLTHIESFPKQPFIEPGKLGNLTKLWGGFHQVTRNRSLPLFGDIRPAPAPKVTEPLKEAVNLTRYGIIEEDDWLSLMFQGDTTASGGRNNTLNRWVYGLQKRGYPYELVEQMVQYVNEHCLEESLPDNEIQLLLRRRI